MEIQRGCASEKWAIRSVLPPIKFEYLSLELHNSDDMQSGLRCTKPHGAAEMPGPQIVFSIDRSLRHEGLNVH